MLQILLAILKVRVSNTCSKTPEMFLVSIQLSYTKCHLRSCIWYGSDWPVWGSLGEHSRAVGRGKCTVTDIRAQPAQQRVCAFSHVLMHGLHQRHLFQLGQMVWAWWNDRAKLGFPIFVISIQTMSRIHRGADKSLARPGRKQARKHVRDAGDFNNIETRAVIKFFFSPCKARRRRKFTLFCQKH